MIDKNILSKHTTTSNKKIYDTSLKNNSNN